MISSTRAIILGLFRLNLVSVFDAVEAFDGIIPMGPLGLTFVGTCSEK